MARTAKTKAPGSDTTPDRRNDAFPSGPSEAEYKVGPGRPPKEYQFKQGQSGNPKGRKRKEPSLLPDLKQLFESAFNKKVKVTQVGGSGSSPCGTPAYSSSRCNLPRATGMPAATSSGSPKGWGQNF